MEEKKFQNKKFTEEQHGDTKKGAQIAKDIVVAAGVLAIVGLLIKKNGVKGLTQGIILIFKIILES